MVLKAPQKEKNFWPKLRKKTSLKKDWCLVRRTMMWPLWMEMDVKIRYGYQYTKFDMGISIQNSILSSNLLKDKNAKSSPKKS
jgi:hypothetical protein